MANRKKLSEKEALKIIGGSLDLWGSKEKGSPPLPKNPNNISLAPIGKDGKEIEWYGRGWIGVIEYANSLGIDYTMIGNYLEKNFGNRTTFNQILLAQAVHQSLEKIDYYRRPRLKMAPRGTESDMHYAIRMDQKNIFKLYKSAGGNAKDKFKGISAMYKQALKERRSFVEAYKYKDELNREQREDLAKRKGKALGTNKIFGKIFKDK